MLLMEMPLPRPDTTPPVTTCGHSTARQGTGNRAAMPGSKDAAHAQPPALTRYFIPLESLREEGNAQRLPTL